MLRNAGAAAAAAAERPLASPMPPPSLPQAASGALSALSQPLSQLAMQASVTQGHPAPSSKSHAILSVIECGRPAINGTRVFVEYVDFFGCEVDIFYAHEDPQKRVLYKASSLARKFSCATNKLAMYLSRHSRPDSGIFQATTFLWKPERCAGLKTGCYLLSLAACKEYEAYHAQRVAARERRHATYAADGSRASAPARRATRSSSGALRRPPSYNVEQLARADKEDEEDDEEDEEDNGEEDDDEDEEEGKEEGEEGEAAQDDESGVGRKRGRSEEPRRDGEEDDPEAASDEADGDGAKRQRLDVANE
jgi:hypothetical protein